MASRDESSKRRKNESGPGLSARGRSKGLSHGSAGDAGRSLRIAVAEDEPDMQEYYRTILSAMGHVVVAVADTGRELIEKCRQQRPDLVITDIRMPDMDGLDAAAELGRDEPAPVILWPDRRHGG